MKKKWVFMFFLLLIIIGAVLFGIAETKLRLVKDNYTYKSKLLTTNYEATETLIMGNEQAFFDVNPEVLKSNALNLAYKNQNLFLDASIIKQHIDSLSNIRQILWPINSALFNETDIDSITLKYKYAQIYGLEHLPISKFNLKKYSRALNTPFKTILNISKAERAKNKVYSKPNGYVDFEAIEDSSVFKIKPTKKLVDSLNNYANEIKYIKEVVAICQSKKIKLFLIALPVQKGFVKDTVVSRTKFLKDVKTLAHQNPDVYSIDLLHNEYFENTDFYSPVLLNEKGAEKCTKLIGELID